MEELENNLPENNPPIAPEVIAEPSAQPQVPPAGEPAHPSPYTNSPYVSYYYTSAAPAAEKPKKKKKKGSFFSDFKFVVCFIIVIGLVLTSGFLTAVFMNNYWQTQMDAITEEHEKQIEDLELKIAAGGGYGVSAPTGSLTPGQVYARNVPAVVSISSEIVSSSYWGTSTGVSSGSGFIISADGYVLTNAHVVEGARSIEVITHSEQTYTATVVGSDSVNDVALLKVEATDLPYVTLGSSGALAVGDQVAAIGNPLGTLSSTMTVGYVSAKDRVVDTDGTYLNMIQTDAAINSGNSGGPLFNMEGEVVGITTAKYSGTSSSGATIEGIGFAIPIDDIQDILSQLKGQGYVSSAYLGVTVKDVSDEAQLYGLPAGAAVQEVVEGYAAQKAGVLPNDIIVKLGDYTIGSTSELTLSLRKFEPGQTTTITVYRSGSEQTMSITLDEKPQE